MNDKLVFCIDCGEMVSMECEPLCGHIQFVPEYDDRGYVSGVFTDFCEMIGGFAFVPPPAVDPDWIEHVVEPGEEFDGFIEDIEYHLRAEQAYRKNLDAEALHRAYLNE